MNLTRIADNIPQDIFDQADVGESFIDSPKMKDFLQKGIDKMSKQQMKQLYWHKFLIRYVGLMI
ncbi:hypothetical protein C0J52_14801 [Blattella germanica]|nr:hypothetical protein C0J52_14801 [Blattella germanica]